MGLEAIWLSVDDILYILVCGWYVFVFDLNRNILKMFDLNRNFLKMFNLNKKFLKIFDLTAQFILRNLRAILFYGMSNIRYI